MLIYREYMEGPLSEVLLFGAAVESGHSIVAHEASHMEMGMRKETKENVEMKEEFVEVPGKWK